MPQSLLGLISEKKAEYLAEQKRASEEAARVKKENDQKRIKNLIDRITQKILDTARRENKGYVVLDATRSYSSPDPALEDLFGDDAIIARHFRGEGLKVHFFSEPIETTFELDYGEYKIGGGDQIRISWE